MPSAIFPTIYNANTRITQGPGFVAIVYEMIHETRVVPLDGSPFTGVRSYLGESRGRWEGDTLVIESRNFNGRAPFRGAGANLKLTERYCVVLQTLQVPPQIEAYWHGDGVAAGS